MQAEDTNIPRGKVTANGARVRELREELGVSIEHLAARAGISARTLSRIELDEGIVNYSTLRAVAEVLGCDAAELLADEGVPA